MQAHAKKSVSSSKVQVWCNCDLQNHKARWCFVNENLNLKHLPCLMKGKVDGIFSHLEFIICDLLQNIPRVWCDVSCCQIPSKLHLLKAYVWTHLCIIWIIHLFRKRLKNKFVPVHLLAWETSLSLHIKDKTIMIWKRFLSSSTADNRSYQSVPFPFYLNTWCKF